MMKHKKTKKTLKNLDAIERKISAIVKKICSLKKAFKNLQQKLLKTQRNIFSKDKKECKKY